MITQDSPSALFAQGRTHRKGAIGGRRRAKAPFRFGAIADPYFGARNGFILLMGSLSERVRITKMVAREGIEPPTPVFSNLRRLA
jgi:hypothetical protein